MALKITDRDELLPAITIYIEQSKPTVRAAVMITQLSLLAPGRPLENHDSIMGRDADLRHTIAVNVINNVQRCENRVLRRVGLPHEARPVEALIVSE